jgi:hypothetical protein
LPRCPTDCAPAFELCQAECGAKDQALEAAFTTRAVQGPADTIR